MGARGVWGGGGRFGGGVCFLDVVTWLCGYWHGCGRSGGGVMMSDGGVVSLSCEVLVLLMW